MAKVPTTGASIQPDPGGLPGPSINLPRVAWPQQETTSPPEIAPDSGDAPTPDDLEQVEDDDWEALNEQKIAEASLLNAMPEDDGTTLDFPPTNDTPSFSHAFALDDPDEYDSVDGDAITRQANINLFHSPGQTSLREIENEVRDASKQAGLPYHFTHEDLGVNYTIERRPGVGDFIIDRNGVKEVVPFPAGGYVNEETGEILPMPATQFNAELNKIVTDPMHEAMMSFVGGPTTQEEIDAANDFLSRIPITIHDLPGALTRGGMRTMLEAFAASPAARFVDPDKIQAARDAITQMSDEAEKRGVIQTGAETLTGFIVAFNPIVRALRVAGFGGSLSTIIAFGLVKAVAVNPDDPNLANLIMEFTAFAEGIGDEEMPVPDEAVFPIGSRASINAIAAYFATKPGSPEEDKAERFLREGLNRVRNFAVGSIEGIGIETVLGFFKALKLLSPKEMGAFEKDVNEAINKLRKEAETQKEKVPPVTLLEPAVEEAGGALQPVRAASRTIGEPISPTVGQRDMRIRQVSLENSIKSGEVTTGNLPAGVDAEEVRSILGQQNLITNPTPGSIPAVEGADANAFLVQSPKVPIVGTGGKKKNLVGPKDIGKFWDRHYVEKYGKQGDPANPADFDIALREAEAEVRFQLNMEKTGDGWYVEDIRLLHEITREVFPEVLGHPIINAAFDGNGIGPEYWDQFVTLIASPMSFGNRPKPNMNVVYKIMDIFFEEGRIPTINPETGKMWTHRNSGREGLEVIQSMIDQIGIKETLKWLFDFHTIRDIRAMKRSTNVFNDTQGMSVPGTETDEAMGAIILGKKGGPFFMNLNGIDDTTSDLWDSRSFNRPFGRMAGPGAVSETGLKDAPVGAERGLQKEFNTELGRRVGKNQMDTQSIRWHYEQNLFSSMGQTNAKPSNFSDGAAQFRDAGRRSAVSAEAVQRDDATSVRGAGSPDKGPVRDESVELVPPSEPTEAVLAVFNEAKLLTPDDLGLVTRNELAPEPPLTPGLQAFLEDNKRILGGIEDSTTVELNMMRRLLKEFKAQNLPSQTAEGEFIPLVTVGEKPVGVPLIQALARIFSDRTGVAPAGEVDKESMAWFESIPEERRGGIATRLMFNPAITEDLLPTVTAHEVGHMMTYRMEFFRKNVMGEVRGDRDIRRAANLGEMTRGEVEVANKDLLFDRLTSTLSKMGYSFQDVENVAGAISKELYAISRGRRPEPWDFAERDIDKVFSELLEKHDLASLSELTEGASNLLTVTRSKAETGSAAATAYLGGTAELTGDGMAELLENPENARQIAPNWVAFVKKMIKGDQVMSRIIVILGLSGIMLPGIQELLEEVDPAVLEEDGG